MAIDFYNREGSNTVVYFCLSCHGQLVNYVLSSITDNF